MIDQHYFINTYILNISLKYYKKYKYIQEEITCDLGESLWLTNSFLKQSFPSIGPLCGEHSILGKLQTEFHNISLLLLYFIQNLTIYSCGWREIHPTIPTNVLNFFSVNIIFFPSYDIEIQKKIPKKEKKVEFTPKTPNFQKQIPKFSDFLYHNMERKPLVGGEQEQMEIHLKIEIKEIK